jgi:hypothetical protein
MITVRYQQRTIYEPLAVNLMPDYQELLWEGWLLKVDKFLEDEDLVKIVREALQKRYLLDFILGTHPITTKGTTQVEGGAKRRSAFDV